MEAVAHEVTHWSDQVSSVWGQDYLVRVFDAYDAARGNREQRFHKVVDQYDEDQRILLPRYYHVVAEAPRTHDVAKPWQIGFSAGQEFTADGHINGSRPLFFVIFGDNETG